MNQLDEKINQHFQGLAARKQFTIDEWIDLLIQSIGFNPEMFGRRSKLTQLIRLIPFCERNYNLIELGPKGIGKSHIYSEFSPHGILLSGGEVSVPKLFVNNATGKIGLVGYWDCVAFDEFAGKQKRVDKALVDILRNYMANKSFSRGIETLGAEASMVFVGNTHDSAFLDRIHFYIPGWEVDIIRGEMFSGGYGFVVDYLAEILRSLRSHDYSDRYLRGATKITVTDPYIRMYYQTRNFMEFLETVVKHKAAEEEVAVHLVTTEDEFKGDQQKQSFEKMQESCRAVGVDFTWHFDTTGSLHARHIVTDHGWKISLDRGFDIFQHYEMNETFAFANHLQQYRLCKAFAVTFIRS